jgi:hypothetical protein
MNSTKTALWFTTLTMAVAVVSYPQFFIFNPYLNGVTVLAVIQTVTIAGWLLTLLAAPIAQAPVFKSDSKLYLLAFVTALLWPISLLAVRFALVLEIGDPGFQYLLAYPIFILTDLVFPVVICVILLARSIQARTEERIRQALESQALLRTTE